MKCYTCATDIANDSKHCPNCGVQISHSQASSVSRDQLMQDKALTEANLHRMRGNWDKAEILAVDALRLNPHSVQAHSLLGDICVGQGKLSQAAQWYQLAIDIHPDSLQDCAKLDDVEKLIMMNPAGASGQSRIPDSDIHPSGTQRLVGLTPSKWFQVIWLLGAVFLVTVVILFSFYSNPRKASDTGIGTLKDSVSTTGNAVLPDMSQAVRAKASGQPSPTPSTSPGRLFDKPLTTATTAPAGQTSNRDTTLNTAISGHLSNDPTTMLNSASINKSTEGASVAVSIQVDPKSTTLDVVRSRAVYASYRAIYAAYSADADLKSVDVSLRITDGKTVEDFFYGSTTRESIQSSNEVGDFQSLLKVFKNVWWAYPPGQQSDQKPDTTPPPAKSNSDLGTRP